MHEIVSGGCKNDAKMRVYFVKLKNFVFY